MTGHLLTFIYLEWSVHSIVKCHFWNSNEREYPEHCWGRISKLKFLKSWSSYIFWIYFFFLLLFSFLCISSQVYRRMLFCWWLHDVSFNESAQCCRLCLRLCAKTHQQFCSTLGENKNHQKWSRHEVILFFPSFCMNLFWGNKHIVQAVLVYLHVVYLLCCVRTLF